MESRQLTTPCIEHQGYINANGYGASWFEGKQCSAHRKAYCLHNNCALADIAGLVVRHRCDNPACIAGDHLELGTHQDNMRDMVERGRQVPGTPRRLTADEVRAIRKAYVPYTRGSPSPTGQSQLARLYGVGQGTIRKIVLNITYKDIT